MSVADGYVAVGSFGANGHVTNSKIQLNIGAEETKNAQDISINGKGYADLLLVKYTKDGLIEWVKTDGSNRNDIFCGIVKTQDGGYISTSTTATTNNMILENTVDGNKITLVRSGGSQNPVIIKYNEDFCVEWARIITTTTANSKPVLQSIICMDDGSYMVCGNSGGTVVISAEDTVNNEEIILNKGAVANNAIVIKLNELGKIDFARDYGIYSGITNISNGIISTNDGGAIMIGGFRNTTITIPKEDTVNQSDLSITANGNYTGYLIKYNNNAKIEKMLVLPTANGSLTSITNTKDSGYIITAALGENKYTIPAELTANNKEIQYEKTKSNQSALYKFNKKNFIEYMLFEEIHNSSIVVEGYNKEYISVGNFPKNNVQVGSIVKYTETILSPEVPPKQNLEITNTKMSYRIKTKVATHTETDSNGNEIEVQGGTISGNGLGYYEEVKYKEDSTKDIIITPDEGYKVASITVNGQDFGFTLNEDGKTVTLSKFLEVLENKEVEVAFEKVETSVLVHHYLWNETNGLTTNRIADDEFISGKVGESYTTSPKVGLGNYELVTNANILGETAENPEDYYIPENAIGTFADEQTEVNYYYKEKTYKLTVHHYLDGTTDKLAEDEIIENFVSGSEYATIKSSSIDRKYKVVLVVGNEAGIITEDTEVTYYYIDTSIDITANKVWQDTLGITRPDEITIALVGTNLTTNEQEYYEEQILSKENNWSYLWADLYVDTETGERINYKVLELTELEDYYLLGIEEKNNTFTITNRFKISLPNSGGSGIKNIILIGIFVVGVGIILIRKNKIMVIIPKNKKTTRKNKKRRKARIARKR